MGNQTKVSQHKSVCLYFYVMACACCVQLCLCVFVYESVCNINIRKIYHSLYNHCCQLTRSGPVWKVVLITVVTKSKTAIDLDMAYNCSKALKWNYKI